MKSQIRRVSVLTSVVVFCFAVSASAGPREDREWNPRIPSKIVKIIQKVFGVTITDTIPVPPKP